MFKIRRKKKNDIDVLEAYEIIVNNLENSQFIIIDVRTPDEYSGGHIENSLNIDIKSKNFPKEIGDLERTNKYLVYCHSGRRSSKAIKLMENMNFTDLKNISGGIVKWKNKGLPLV